MSLVPQAAFADLRNLHKQALDKDVTITPVTTQSDGRGGNKKVKGTPYVVKGRVTSPAGEQETMLAGQLEPQVAAVLRVDLDVALDDDYIVEVDGHAWDVVHVLPDTSGMIMRRALIRHR